MKFSNVCPNCGEKSDEKEKYCFACGSEKIEINAETGITESIFNDLDSKVTSIENPQIYLRIIISLIVFLSGYFLLPEFIKNSETFWLIYIISVIYGLIKQIDSSFKTFRGIFAVSKFLLWGYLGAGVGNLISNTGKISHIPFSYHFNPNFIYSQFTGGNMLVFLGFIAGILTYKLTTNYLKNYTGNW